MLLVNECVCLDVDIVFKPRTILAYPKQIDPRQRLCSEEWITGYVSSCVSSRYTAQISQRLHNK